MAQRDACGVRLVARNGFDFADRFPLAVAAVSALPARSCVIDGGAIACDENGLSVCPTLQEAVLAWHRLAPG